MENKELIMRLIMQIVYAIFLAFIILISFGNIESNSLGGLGANLMGCVAIWALTILIIR